jgi:hypothetical protein
VTLSEPTSPRQLLVRRQLRGCKPCLGRKKIAKTIAIKSAVAGKVLACSFKAKLKKGAYAWTVRAIDNAGNIGRISPAKRLSAK